MNSSNDQRNFFKSSDELKKSSPSFRIRRHHEKVKIFGNRNQRNERQRTNFKFERKSEPGIPIVFPHDIEFKLNSFTSEVFQPRDLQLEVATSTNEPENSNEQFRRQTIFNQTQNTSNLENNISDIALSKPSDEQIKVTDDVQSPLAKTVTSQICEEIKYEFGFPKKEVDEVLKRSLEYGTPGGLTNAQYASLGGFRTGTDAWIESEHISQYFSLITKRKEQFGGPNVYLMSVDIFQILQSEEICLGYLQTAPEIADDALNSDYILMPWSTGNHWLMVNVDVKKKKIQIYDSRLGFPYEEYLEIFKSVVKIMKNMMITKCVEVEEWTTGKFIDGPKQSNNYDCGIFLLCYVEHFTRGAKLSFKQTEMTKYRRKIAFEISIGKIVEQ